MRYRRNKNSPCKSDLTHNIKWNRTQLSNQKAENTRLGVFSDTKNHDPNRMSTGDTHHFERYKQDES